jgi:hypothetical protein
MTALERLKHLPGWPARMTAPVAAAYMSVSQTTFLTRFGARGVKEGGNTFWAKAQLDQIVAEQFDLVVVPAVADTVEMAYDRWKASRKK